MKLTTLIQLTQNCYAGQLVFEASNSSLVYREDASVENAPQIDVTALIGKMEDLHSSIDDMLTACSDQLYTRLCVDCSGVSSDELGCVESELTQFADILGERLCDDCAYDRNEDSDDYARNGVSRSDFY